MIVPVKSGSLGGKQKCCAQKMTFMNIFLAIGYHSMVATNNQLQYFHLLLI